MLSFGLLFVYIYLILVDWEPLLCFFNFNEHFHQFQLRYESRKCNTRFRTASIATIHVFFPQNEYGKNQQQHNRLSKTNILIFDFLFADFSRFLFFVCPSFASVDYFLTHYFLQFRFYLAKQKQYFLLFLQHTRQTTTFPYSSEKETKRLTYASHKHIHTYTHTHQYDLTNSPTTTKAQIHRANACTHTHTRTPYTFVECSQFVTPTHTCREQGRESVDPSCAAALTNAQQPPHAYPISVMLKALLCSNILSVVCMVRQRMRRSFLDFVVNKENEEEEETRAKVRVRQLYAIFGSEYAAIVERSRFSTLPSKRMCAYHSNQCIIAEAARTRKHTARTRAHTHTNTQSQLQPQCIRCYVMLQTLKRRGRKNLMSNVHIHLLAVWPLCSWHTLTYLSANLPKQLHLVSMR